MVSQQCEEKGLKFAGVTKVIIIAISKLLHLQYYVLWNIDKTSYYSTRNPICATACQ